MNVAFIFTNAAKNPGLQYNFRISVTSLFKSSTVPIHLNLITDEDGIHLSKSIINEIQTTEKLDSSHIKVILIVF